MVQRRLEMLLELPAQTVAALSVYVEPLVADARVAIVGDGELGLHARLLELGARTVHVYDPDPARVARTADEVPRGVSVRMLRDDFDVRDGAFDLIVIPDLGVLPDPAAAIVRLRRIVDPRGTVVVMGRARTARGDDPSFPELAPAVVEYTELYDLFALQFESVTMTGVLPFSGVVFAELGAGEDLAVSVDTRLVEPEAPGVFVVVAGREAAALDPYAIVQVDAPEPLETETSDVVQVLDTLDTLDTADALGALETDAAQAAVSAAEAEARELEVAVAFAAMERKAAHLAAQVDEHRARLAAIDLRRAEEHAGLEAHAEQIAFERDTARKRASDLEEILGAMQQSLSSLSTRAVAAEGGMLERDDRIAALNAELDARTQESDELAAHAVDPAFVAELVSRGERAEVSLALHVADLALVSEAHATETASLEEQLRSRARVIAAMDKELGRREQLVRELVASLEEARENVVTAAPFQAAPAVPGVAPEEVVRLRRKLDDLALEVARREGELVAQQWRITELENDKARLLASPTPPTPPAPSSSRASLASSASPSDVARMREELDALRQALTQEHAARVAAESAEELARARAELDRQEAPLEQMQGVPIEPER